MERLHSSRIMEKVRRHNVEKKMKLFFKEIQSPVGKLKLIATDTALVAVLWEKEKANRVKLPPATKTSEHVILNQTEAQLNEYFSGHRTKFDFPMQPLGTEFQIKVWQALRQIPFGVTKSYSEIAQSINSPKASRAVGAANGKNPISIIVPCHRVIGTNGKLTGFAGGLKVKSFLLQHEGSGNV